MPLILLLLATGDIVTQVFHLGRENVRGVGVRSMHWPNYCNSSFLVQ